MLDLEPALRNRLSKVEIFRGESHSSQPTTLLAEVALLGEISSSSRPARINPNPKFRRQSLPPYSKLGNLE